MSEYMPFPPLYKKSETGAVVEWTIRVERLGGAPLVVDEGIIVMRWGQEGGAFQETRDVVTEGKNIGKKNETSPYEQACAEAQSRHEKQQKARKYCTTRENALAGVRSALVEGGVDPMLAQKYRDHAKKIVWPAYSQAKLDGIRCIAVIEGGGCTLWSRTRKLITGVPHISQYLAEKFAGQSVVLDGELYNHSFKADFEKITSFVRQATPQPGHEVVQYHVYDMVREGTFEERSSWLSKNLPVGGPVVAVPTIKLQSEEEMLEFFSTCLAEGWEGCMVRNAASKYENKRSYGLQKVKEMQDAEFQIVGVEEGRGSMAGKAIFVCVAENGDAFKAKMKGSLDNLAQYVQNPDLALGKLLTVQFQNLSAYGIPRFPVGLRIRDYE